MDSRSHSSSSRLAPELSGATAAVPAAGASSAAVLTGSSTTPLSFPAGMPLPVPPSVPKPRNLPTGLRHKYVNISIGSLPTCEASSRENIAEDFDPAVLLEGSSSDSESCLSTESDTETETLPKRTGLRESDIVRIYGPDANLRVPSFSSEEDEALSAATDKLSCNVSEVDLDEIDLFLDDSLPPPGPLLNLEEGIQPLTALPPCPPISWLVAAGFDVPSSRGFTAVPRAPVCGERPTQYLNLFSRQMIARQQTSDLTFGALSRHQKSVGRARHLDSLPAPRLPSLAAASKAAASNAAAPAAAPAACDGSPAEVLAQNGEWLQAFIARARAVPLYDVAEGMMGADIGKDVAAFLDGLSDGSDCGASMCSEDQPDGLHVTAPKICSRPIHRGRGRAGFYVDNEVAIATPGRSQSPAPRRAPPPLPLEAPRPPMVRAPAVAAAVVPPLSSSAVAALRRPAAAVPAIV